MPCIEVQVKEQDPKMISALDCLSKKLNKVFVTGYGGFLGKALCQHLRSANIEVVGLARGHYPELQKMGVQCFTGDLSDLKKLKSAMQGCDLVFHVASKAGVWGNKKSYFQPNVLGTENIINACLSQGIPALVYTSTPSVTFSGKDENGIDESAPYAVNFLNFYGLSKAIAEEKVLKANSHKFKTTAIRPHLIWGPGDPHLIPRVIDRAEKGKLKLIGKVDKLVDTIYIDNAVYAHILAAIELSNDDSSCAGKAYFVSNEQPITMAEMLKKILACKNIQPLAKNQRVPSKLAYAVGTLLEWAYLALRKKDEPIMTRFVARQLSTSHYFDISAAKHDLGYEALVSIEEGMSRLQL
ncbi:MAG TPA: NAD-dependent epimerase/dehydratase family protein [Psychromonas hadalis]|nr:NAD-dependent epimerase/dehydratase family protein [Psychromonas hadalis]